MSASDSATSFGIGLLVGVAAGIAIGVLYAPRAGSETRTMLKEKAEAAKDRAEEIIDEAKERARKIIDDARGKAGEVKAK